MEHQSKREHSCPIGRVRREPDRRQIEASRFVNNKRRTLQQKLWAFVHEAPFAPKKEQSNLTQCSVAVACSDCA
jgi:hypothetical protein